MLFHKATWINIKQNKDHDGAERGDEYQVERFYLVDQTLNSWDLAVLPRPTDREGCCRGLHAEVYSMKECGVHVIEGIKSE